MANTPKVFISHTSSDKEIFVRKLATDLRQAGAEVFFDEWSIRAAERLRDKISAAIRQCTHFLVIISNRSLRSNWVKIELDQALILEIQGKGPKVLPIIFGRVQSESIPLDILGLRWVAFRTASGPKYKQSLLVLLKALNLGDSSQDIPLEEIRKKQRIFVREHLAGTLNYETFWSFWNKPMAAANWHKLLYIIKDNVISGEIEEARTNVEILTGMLQMYEISTDLKPRTLETLLSLPQVIQNGILLGWILQLTNLFRIVVDRDAVLRFLSSPSPHAIHATCRYIEETGIEIDDQIADSLLQIVESPDDQRYYFSGVDSEREPMVVDARHAAATALMLADPAGIPRESIRARVRKHYPKVVEDIGRISLIAMVNSSFGGSRRKTIPASGRDMNEILGELLSNQQHKSAPKRVRSKAKSGSSGVDQP